MNMILLNEWDTLSIILIDRLFIFVLLFGLLMAGAFTRNSTIDKSSSFKEMLILSLFFALAITIKAEWIMNKVEYSMFLFAMFVGLVEKEVIVMLKKYIILKIKGFVNKNLKEDEKKDDKKE